MIRKIAACLLLGVSACTIIPDDSLTKLPTNVQVSQLNIKFSKENSTEAKEVTVKLIRSAQKIEINWPADVDIFFYDKNASKSVYQLNAAGYAEKITTTFVDGKEIVDEIVYNGNNRITELRNSFFNDRLKFYYKNDQLDSIAKTRTLPNGTIQTGFYKRTDVDKFVSIFPFNSGQGYSLNYNFIGNCSCDANTPAANELNKTGYFFSDQIDQYSNSYFLETDYRQTLNNQYCSKVFTNSTSESGTNFYNKPNFRYNYSTDCYNSGQNYFSTFSLIPEIVPDFSSAYLATVDSELKWINSNSTKTPNWLFEIYYNYTPISK